MSKKEVLSKKEITKNLISKAKKEAEILNAKLVDKYVKDTSERHVVEENEPLMDDFIDNFHQQYGDKVVGKSMKEIIKIIKQ